MGYYKLFHSYHSRAKDFAEELYYYNFFLLFIRTQSNTSKRIRPLHHFISLSQSPLFRENVYTHTQYTRTQPAKMIRFLRFRNRRTKSRSISFLILQFIWASIPLHSFQLLFISLCGSIGYGTMTSAERYVLFSYFISFLEWCTRSYRWIRLPSALYKSCIRLENPLFEEDENKKKFIVNAVVVHVRVFRNINVQTMWFKLCELRVTVVVSNLHRSHFAISTHCPMICQFMRASSPCHLVMTIHRSFGSIFCVNLAEMYSN